MRSFPFLISVALFAQITLAQTSTTTQTSTAPHPRAATHTTGTSTAHRTTAAKPAVPALTTDDQKIVYAIGLFTYQRGLESLNLSPAEVAIVQRAIADAAAGKPAENIADWGPKFQGFAKQRQDQKAQQEKPVSLTVLAKAAGEPGAVKTNSGLVYQEVRPGSGDSPKATDKVRVNYRGTLPDGTEFDSSYKRNQPAEFPLNGVIKCWTEGVQKMKPGGKAVLYCPSDLAYGDQGRPGIPPGAALRFEIELLAIVPPAPSAAPAAGPAISAPPPPSGTAPKPQ